ncbi:niemann-Pick type C2 disease patched like cholesterol transporter of the family [Cryptosporidium sp. chipmunk genotype I]|uniref:niemann-Pick type C2 disease patched like cholesterol transporter of the family n=1 Tax=Cryptosporidium sp. chipmunk genotype I TaxID=1280935 RepID=UPI00351A6C0F|nr:niemann-Pick type C2 disease patched like cholesterol transporter of the family [Cryptosporidium sp. chipmunk genotype I]
MVGETHHLDECSLNAEDLKTDLEIPLEEACNNPNSTSRELKCKSSVFISDDLVCSFELDQNKALDEREKIDYQPEDKESYGSKQENASNHVFGRFTDYIRARTSRSETLNNLSQAPTNNYRNSGSILFSILKGLHGTHLFDKYTKKIGKHISLVAAVYPRSLLIIGNVMGLVLGLIVALGLMKLYPFHLEVNGSPDLFLPTKSIHSSHKEELRKLFGPESVTVPILYSNKGPPGSSLLDYITLKQIWRNEMSIQAIKVVDKEGKEWGWEDICYHQPTGSVVTGIPCVALSLFGLFMINESSGIFSEKDFDEAFTGECCSGISIAKFAAGNFIKQSYFPYQYKYDENLPEWPFEIHNTQEMLSIYRLNTTIPEEVRIAWENKVTDHIKSVQRRNKLVSIINTEENPENGPIQFQNRKLQENDSSDSFAGPLNNGRLQELSIDSISSDTTKDVSIYPNNWGVVHYSLEFVSSETTELANKETPLLLATFALMIIFMAICISGKFPKRSRVLLSSTVVMITVYATVGSFATGMIFGVPISPLTPLFIHMLLGVVVSYMIISVRTYMKTRIYIRVSFHYLPLLNPRYVRISGNEVFLEITQYIYKPWKGFVYLEAEKNDFCNEMMHRNNHSYGSTSVGLIYGQDHSSNEISSFKSSNSVSNSYSNERNQSEQTEQANITTDCMASKENEIRSNKLSSDQELYPDYKQNGFKHMNEAKDGSDEIHHIIDTCQINDSNNELCLGLEDIDRKMWDNDTLLKIRLSVSGSVVFSSITLTCLTSCAALFLGTVVDFPIVRYYCIHAGFGILYLFIFHWLIFLPSFVLDEKRIYRRKYDVFPLLKFKPSNKRSKYLFIPEEPKRFGNDNGRDTLENSSINLYTRVASPSNVSLSASNDSRKGTIFSIFTRHVYRVRGEVVKNYQRYKTWWGDKSSNQRIQPTHQKQSNNELNEINNMSFNETSSLGISNKMDKPLLSYKNDGNTAIQNAINNIDMHDIWIGRLMVESSKADVIMRLMCNFTFRLFACVFFIVVVILGILYGKNVNTEFSAVRYLPPNSPLHYFVETLANSWGSEPRQVYLVFPGSDKVSWNNKHVREEFINLVDNVLLKDPAIMTPIVSWIHDFEIFHFGTNLPEDPDHIPSFIRECSPELDNPRPPLNDAPKEEFYEFLNEWRNRKVFKGDESQEDTICVVSKLSSKLTASTLSESAPFIRNIIPEMHDETMLVFKNGNPSEGIQSFRIMTMIKHSPLNSQYNFETMKRLSNLIETVFEKDFPGTYIYSDWFLEAERDLNILYIVWKLLLYITLGVSIMLCIIQNPLTGIFIGLVVGGINITVILIMYITGLIFDIVAFMVLATAVSFSIEYIVHITHLFLLTKRDSGVERIRDSLLDMGPNVIYAVISTFLGVILLAFSTSESFKVFLWITTIVLCVSATAGIMITPAILSIALDFGNFIRDYYNRKRQQEIDDTILEIKSNNMIVN